MGKFASEGVWENGSIGTVDRAVIDGWEKFGKSEVEKG